MDCYINTIHRLACYTLSFCSQRYTFSLIFISCKWFEKKLIIIKKLKQAFKASFEYVCLEKYKSFLLILAQVSLDVYQLIFFIYFQRLFNYLSRKLLQPLLLDIQYFNWGFQPSHYFFINKLFYQRLHIFVFFSTFVSNNYKLKNIYLQRALLFI